jgi:outer membrane protein assembly factor BamB
MFVSTSDGRLYALDTGSGTEEWTYDMGQTSRSELTVVNGTAYIGHQGNQVEGKGVDAKTGEQRWSFELDARVNSSPTVVDGVVYLRERRRKLSDAATHSD